MFYVVFATLGISFVVTAATFALAVGEVIQRGPQAEKH